MSTANLSIHQTWILSAFSAMKLLTANWILIVLQQFWVFSSHQQSSFGQVYRKVWYTCSCAWLSIMLNNVAGCLDSALAELDHGHFTSLQRSGFFCWCFAETAALWLPLFQLVLCFTNICLLLAFSLVYGHLRSVLHLRDIPSLTLWTLNSPVICPFNPVLPQTFLTVLKSNIPHQNSKIVWCDDKLIVHLLYVKILTAVLN